MMHKVKDVVTKFFHPSFLFSPNNDTDTDRSKRKRSGSTEEIQEEEEEERIDRTPRNDHIDDNRSSNNTKDDEPQLTDDEDNYSQDVPSTERQTKRRRTANYQHIMSTNSHHESDGTSPPSIDSTDSRVSSAFTTPILRRTSIEQNYSETMNRSRPLYNHSSTYRRVTSNYDPSKSPLFSVGNRTTTNVQSNETAANHLLATSLLNRSSSSVSTNKQSSATLTNPITNRRDMFSTNYSSVSSGRLSYIERLRRRTLQDCIRLDRTLDHQPLSTTTEDSEPTTTTPILKPTKTPEKECGIQCDITSVEPSQKSQATFPPKEIRNEILSMPPTADKIQTNSSITIEKRQPLTTTNTITKPKVLGNITPFSWPKFVRAQDEFAKKYPDKCRNDAGKSNVNVSSTTQSQTYSSTISKSSSFSPRPTESIWKCPCCTKEHSAQTSSCSLCHGINPNYKKPSAIQSSTSVAKELLPSTTMTSAVALTKESNIFTPVASIPNQTVTKESIVPTSSPAITTSSISTTFSPFVTIPSASIPITAKENPVATTTSSSILSFGILPSSTVSTITNTANSSSPLFGIAPTTSHQSAITTTTTSGSSSTISPFGTITTFTSLTPIKSSTSTITPFTFGTSTFGTSTTVTSVNPSTTTMTPSFGIATTKESPVITGRQFPFSTSSSLDTAMITSPSTTSPLATPFQPFSSISSVGFTPVVTTSSSMSSLPFGSSSTFSLPKTTSVATIPSVSTGSSTVTSPSSIVTAVTPTTNTSITPSFSIFSAATSVPSTDNLLSFPKTSATGPFQSASSTVTSASPAFGTSTFNLTPVSTAASTSNPSLSFGAITSSRPFAPSSITSISANNPPTFGSMPPFGTSSISVERPTNPTPLFNFGVTSPNTQISAASTAPSVGGFAFGVQSSAPPLFGATSQSTFPSYPMTFGIQPSTSTTLNSFTSPSSTSDLSNTSDSGSALFNIGSGDIRSDSPRRIIRARRLGKP